MLDLMAMGAKLWEFIDGNGTFASANADRIKTLYFPLCNTHPIMSSVSPDLHGDIKTDYNSFLLEPVSRLGLVNSKSSRNFWISTSAGKAWSATGASGDTAQLKQDKFKLEAGLLWHKITRRNNKIGLQAEITSFIPSSGEPVEIMRVNITNISASTIRFIATAAIPIYARSCSNLHDHRHVTSLLQRVSKERSGITVKPTLLFDEAGHKVNQAVYFVFGTDQNNHGPRHIYTTQEGFCGEGGDLLNPDAVFKNILPAQNHDIQGKEAMGALRFNTHTLRPKQTSTFIILMGISKDKTGTGPIWKKFNSPAKIHSALSETEAFWQRKSTEISVATGNSDFDNWFKWVSVQPFLRKTFGCSFLPDFDYGKGGRGWRDLWQDTLALILNNASHLRPLLINNFSGVRIDGSNATIIGQCPGEFISDRNNISRVWMDHGIWPLLTTYLYIQQTGDLKILLEETGYFRDHQLCRGRERDTDWKADAQNILKDRNGNAYKGTVLEHILTQNLVQFYNVGEHNHVRLEGADWNDGLDMAPEHGESVAFSSMYAQNLLTLAEMIRRLDTEGIAVLKELSMLLDTAGDQGIDHSQVPAKRALLERYFQETKSSLSGEKTYIAKDKLIHDLTLKGEWMRRHIRANEWLEEGFFNGYYNNDKERLEGRIDGILRMTLTGQVFAVMSGVATGEQTKTLLASIGRYLKDKRSGGIRLNTDFKAEQPNLGRAFSFVYGEKENGAFFNHMSVMLAYALYKQGFAADGYEVLSSIYDMAAHTAKSRIYPCLPEYFNGRGRGMYSYLTGSASWFVLTLLTQAYGIRGEYGDLVIEPKLCAAQFKRKVIRAVTHFAQKALEVKFINPRKKDFGKYSILKASLNAKTVGENLNPARLIIARDEFLALADEELNCLEILLD